MNLSEKMEEYFMKIAPKEFSEPELKEVSTIVHILGHFGRMLSTTKNNYNGKCIFNANICTKKRKLWYGDINFERDEKKLEQIANLIKQDLYILREMDARFENENAPLLDKAVFIVRQKNT